MNSETNLLIDQIKKPLQKGIISDRKEYDEQIEKIILQSPELQKIYNKHRSNLGEFCRKSTHEAKLSEITRYIEHLLKQFPKHEQAPTEILSHPITQQDRDYLQELGYKQPPVGVRLRGSYAVKIAAIVLGIPHDHIIPNDVDGYILPYCKTLKNNIADFYHSDTIGFVETNENPELLLNKTDICSNQIVITENTIFYTNQYKDSLINQITYFNSSRPVEILGRRYYVNHQGSKIYTSNVLYRGYKALVEGKIEGIRIPQYMTYTKNLREIYDHKYSLALLRKILHRDIYAGSKQLYKLEILFQNLGIIEIDQTIFNYFNNIISQNHFVNLHTDILSNQFELNRMMKKLIKHILDLEGYHEFDVNKIDTRDTSEIILTIPQQEVPQEFVERFIIRKEQVLKASDQY